MSCIQGNQDHHMRMVVPYDLDGNLARAFNQEIAISPPGSYVIFKDRDVLILDPHYGHKIQQVIDRHGEAFYTCRTNRINCKWQKYQAIKDDDIKKHYDLSQVIWEEQNTSVSIHTNDQLWSGHLMVIPVDRWEPLPEDGGIMGIDNLIHKMAISQGCDIRLMRGIYVYHIYSFHNKGHRTRDKSHLL